MSEEDQEIEEVEEQEELYEHFHIVVDPKQDPLRIDKFIANRVEQSRSKIQTAATSGAILVNGKAVKSNYKVRPRDEIKVVFPKPVFDYQVIPEEIPLDILYEDADVIVLNKQSGLVVHPGYGNYTGTLVHGLAYHVKDLPVPKGGTDRPGLVHRLDKDTSGVMVVAKTEHALSHLAKQFFDRSTDREYTALAWGYFDEDEGTVDAYIGRSLRNRKNMEVFPEDEGIGKHSVTHWKVKNRYNYVTEITCKLETGRTHQIRVHMQHLGHPLFNDKTYGGDRIRKGTIYSKYKQFVDNAFKICTRHALDANKPGFEHPTTGERMYFETELPEDMRMVIDKWHNYISKH